MVILWFKKKQSEIPWFYILHLNISEYLLADQQIMPWLNLFYMFWNKFQRIVKYLPWARDKLHVSYLGLAFIWFVFILLNVFISFFKMSDVSFFTFFSIKMFSFAWYISHHPTWNNIENHYWSRHKKGQNNQNKFVLEFSCWFKV